MADDAPDGSRERARAWGARRRQVLVVVVTFALVGLACGWLWHALWEPGPTGIAVGGEAYFDPDDEFRGTGLYMTIAGAAGIVLGVVFAFLFEDDEVVTLGAILLGATIAAVLMSVVGHRLGPPSASDVAEDREDFEEVAADLHVGALPAYVALPGAALVGNVVVLVGFTRRPDRETPSA